MYSQLKIQFRIARQPQDTNKPAAAIIYFLFACSRAEIVSLKNHLCRTLPVPAGYPPISQVQAFYPILKNPLLTEPGQLRVNH